MRPVGEFQAVEKKFRKIGKSPKKICQISENFFGHWTQWTETVHKFSMGVKILTENFKCNLSLQENDMHF